MSTETTTTGTPEYIWQMDVFGTDYDMYETRGSDATGKYTRVTVPFFGIDVRDYDRPYSISNADGMAWTQAARQIMAQRATR